jgi:hypothetical protein
MKSIFAAVFVVLMSPTSLACEAPHWLDVSKSSWIISGEIDEVFESNTNELSSVVIKTVDYLKGGNLGERLTIKVSKEELYKLKKLKKEAIFFLITDFYDATFLLSSINCSVFDKNKDILKVINELVITENEIKTQQPDFRSLTSSIPSIRFDLIDMAVSGLSEPTKVDNALNYLFSLNEEEVIILISYIRRLEPIAILKPPHDNEYKYPRCRMRNIHEVMDCILIKKLGVTPYPVYRWGNPFMEHAEQAQVWEVAGWYYMKELKDKYKKN